MAAAYGFNQSSDLAVNLPSTSSQCSNFCASAKNNSSPNTYSIDSAALISAGSNCSGAGGSVQTASVSEDAPCTKRPFARWQCLNIRPEEYNSPACNDRSPETIAAQCNLPLSEWEPGHSDARNMVLQCSCPGDQVFGINPSPEDTPPKKHGIVCTGHNKWGYTLFVSRQFNQAQNFVRDKQEAEWLTETGRSDEIVNYCNDEYPYE